MRQASTSDKPMNGTSATTTHGERKLSFWSQNLCRSNYAQQDWLVSLNARQYSIEFAQEPYIDFLGNSRANHTWVAIYPTTHRKNPKDTRTYTLVHTSINQDQWAQIPVPSPDVTAIRLSDEHGDLYTFNVYLDQSHSDALFAVDRAVREIRRKYRRSRRPAYIIWAGDFNCHLPIWDKEWNHHLFTRANLRKAQTLIDKLADYDLKMALPQGIPTLESMAMKNFTRTNNVFISDDLFDRCTRCTTLPEHRPPKTDHIPVVWDLDFALERKMVQQQLNWGFTNWEEFSAKL
jgi:hypothetical protein